MEELWKLVSPFISAVIGGGVVAWANSRLTERRDRNKWRLDFVEKQLKLLYSPLYGMRQEVRILSEHRVKLADLWKDISQDGSRSPQDVKAQSKRHVEFDNRQLEETLLPQYRKMVATLRDNLWLAEPETLVAMKALIEFVDGWDRVITKSVDANVVIGAGHGEAQLHAFYDHLEAVHGKLTKMVKEGRVD